MIHQNITESELKSLNPVQPLILLINSFFKQTMLIQSLPVSPLVKYDKPPSKITFNSINTTINYNWVDLSLIQKSNKKEDKALVPSYLWDKRILSSFPDCKSVQCLIDCLRSFMIRVYQARLTKSLLLHLRITFSTQWAIYCNRIRSHTKGGDFDKSIKVERVILIKASKSAWFEWLSGSTLIF